MKAFKLTIISVFLLTASANAQFFVGGDISIMTSGKSSKAENTKMKGASVFGINFNPEAGIILSDKMLVGAQLDFGMVKNDDRQDPSTVKKSSHFGLVPFANYAIAKFGKFSVVTEAKMPFIFGRSSTTVGNTETKDPSTFYFGLGLAPLLEYEVSEHLVLHTKLNFMSLNFGLNTSKTETMGIKVTTTQTSFKVGADANNVVNIGNITVGARYIF